MFFQMHRSMLIHHVIQKVGRYVQANRTVDAQWRSQGGGTRVHVPLSQLDIFSKYNQTEHYVICDDLWLCSVEYSAFVSSFLDPHRGSAPGPRWGTSVPQTPLLSPVANSWLRPCRCLYVITVTCIVDQQNQRWKWVSGSWVTGCDP